MTFIGWVLFTIINSFIFLFIEYKHERENKFHGSILGLTGALSGSLFLYSLINGNSREFAMTFAMIIILESFFLMTLLFMKTVKL